MLGAGANIIFQSGGTSLKHAGLDYHKKHSLVTALMVSRASVLTFWTAAGPNTLPG